MAGCDRYSGSLALVHAPSRSFGAGGRPGSIMTAAGQREAACCSRDSGAARDCLQFTVQPATQSYIKLAIQRRPAGARAPIAPSFC